MIERSESMKFNQEDIERILEWMNNCRELMGCAPDLDESFIFELTSDKDCKQCSCGGFTFIKTKNQ